MELPEDVRVQFQKLIQKQQFLENIDDFMRISLGLIYNSQAQINYEDQQVCPTAILLALSHYICLGKSPINLSSLFPQKYQQKFIQACQKYTPEEPPIKQQIRSICDVKWKINIVLGRQLWEIEVFFTDNSKLKFVLNYEQLSVLVFKIGQIVNYLPSIKI